MISVQGFGLKKEFEEDLVGSTRSMLEDLKLGYENIRRMLEA